MKINVKITSPFAKKGYPPDRPYHASDMANLVKIGASLFGEKTYLRFKRNRQDMSLSYQDFARMVDCFGTAVAEMGLSDAAVAVIGETTPEYIVSYLATVNGGGMIVPLDKELATQEIANFIRRANVRFVVYSHHFTEKILSIADKLDEVVCFAEISHEFFPYPDATGSDKPITDRFVPFEAFIRRGTALLNAGYNAYTSHVIDVEKPCACLFTSGTTGTSKGVLLSQKNITAAINASWRMIDEITSDDVLVSVLPIHHTYEMTCGILTPILIGCTVCINENLKTVVASMKQYQPTVLTLVPLFVSTIYKKIQENVHRKGMEKKLALARSISDKALLVGVDMRKTLFADILEVFGGRLDRIICGGAPLNPEMAEFFRSIGIRITQGYGITECSPLVSVSPFRWLKPDSVGLPVPCIEARIGDGTVPVGETGEIVVRGDNVMVGYKADPEATAAVLDDEGWFCTGDIGYMDKDGFIYITGRKKNVIVLQNGKNVFPEEIEEYIGAIDLISECVDEAKTEKNSDNVAVTALIYPDFTRAEELGLSNIEAISEALRVEINKLNTTLPLFKQIRGVEIRKNPFVKTSSQKIMRHRLDE